MELEQLFAENKRLVHKISRVYEKRGRTLGFDYGDVFQFASEGFIKAVDKFDTEKGKFSTFCVEKMKGEIRRRFRDWNVGPKIPREAKMLAMKISLSPQSVEEVTKDADERIKDVAVYHVTKGLPVYTSEKIKTAHDGKDQTVGDFLESDQDYSNVFVSEFLESLTERERYICERLLLQDTQREIGRNIGVSQVQVARLLKNKIRPKLEDYINDNRENATG